ncbi:MAG: efflux transporter outer membrane subunit [Vibrio sp.]
MNKLTLSVIASALILSGCSMAPDYEMPQVAVTDIYVNQDATGTSRQGELDNLWWKQLNDPQLDALVQAAQQQNITLQIASQRIQSAQAYHQAVASFKVPTISVGAGYANLRLSKNEAMTGGLVDANVNVPDSLGGGNLKLLDRDPEDFYAGINASWELDLFGRIDSMSKAASIRADEAKIMKTAVNTAITSDVINNYLQYQGANERIKIAKANIADQEETLKLVESLSRYGYGSELDVANAKAALASTQAALPMLETAKSVHLGRLAILLGENVAEVKNRIHEKPLPKLDALVPTGLPSELLTRRPDIAIAQKEIEATNEDVGVAIANQYPKFYLTGAPSLISGNSGDLFDSDSGAWTLGAGISWNIFDGGRTQAMIDMQKSGFKQSVLTYQNTVNSAFSEVETALSAYGNSQNYHSHILEADYQAQHAVDKAKSLYRAGLVNHLSVLDAQRQRNQLQDAEVQARLSTVTNLVLLQKSLGGDWTLPAAHNAQDEGAKLTANTNQSSPKTTENKI